MLQSLMNESLFVVIAIFLMSLIGAYILFKILKATAAIKNEKFHAGGALAGFIILYGTMFQSYQSLHYIEETENKLKVAQKALERDEINGKLVPNAQNAKIVLATQQTDADDDGNFRLLTQCINPEDEDIKVYVISQDGRYKSLRISSKDQMKGIQIKSF